MTILERRDTHSSCSVGVDMALRRRVLLCGVDDGVRHCGSIEAFESYLEVCIRNIVVFKHDTVTCAREEKQAELKRPKVKSALRAEVRTDVHMQLRNPSTLSIIALALDKGRPASLPLSDDVTLVPEQSENRSEYCHSHVQSQPRGPLFFMH
jgi:hypothetical protein